MIRIERGLAGVDVILDIILTLGDVGHSQVRHRVLHETCHVCSFRVYALTLAQEIRNIQIAGIVRRHHFMLGGLVE